MSVALPIETKEVPEETEARERVIGRSAHLEPTTVQLFVHSPEDAPTILFEAHEGNEDAGFIGRLLGRAPRRNAEISAIRQPGVFDPSDVTYPKLYSGIERLVMGSKELADELDLIAGMGWPKSFAQPYVYSVHVLEPGSYRFDGDPSRYGAPFALHAVRAEASAGHLRHETLYDTEATARPQLLRDFLR